MSKAQKHPQASENKRKELAADRYMKQTKSRRSFSRYHFWTFFFISVLALGQIVLWVMLLSNFSLIPYMPHAYDTYITYAMSLISLVVVLYIVSREMGNAFKLAWVIPILLFPLAGGVMYIISRGRSMHKKHKNRRQIVRARLNEIFDLIHGPASDNMPPLPDQKKLARFLQNMGFPVQTRLDAEYLSSGEHMNELMKEQLRLAKKYIFLEFFIIQPGVMLNEILRILKERADDGVEVRIIYDGMGSIKTAPRGFPKMLQEYGIKARIFRRYTPLMSTYQNNRDHRKIVVIDGKVGFCGGINLADEYINEYERFGHWKDSGLMLRGGDAQYLTKYFLEQWYSIAPFDENIERFFFPIDEIPSGVEEPTGAVSLYTADPYEKESVAEGVYAALIDSAREYLYIMTPYLIPGEDILMSLKRAAKGGADVRIITPYHPDKKFVHLVSRSYYKSLIESGVRVFEYTPGFCHCKCFVTDDSMSVVGSINLDYRALYLHYENAALLFGADYARRIKKDFMDTQEKCMEITLGSLPKKSFLSRVMLMVLRVFEPLL